MVCAKRYGNVAAWIGRLHIEPSRTIGLSYDPGT